MKAMIILKKKEEGVSLIALVITIIVVSILVAITFSNSNGTIGKAGYSKFVTNIVEVQEAIAQKATAVKGKSVSSGRKMTDEQAYNYVASGGKTEDDVLPKGRVPDYTIIKKTADIGMKLPVMKVNTKTSSKVEVTYAITKLGKVFIWPPYEYEGKYIIDETSEVSETAAEATGFVNITVASVPLRISTNTNGELEQIELLDDGLTRKEFDEIKEKVKVGGYVNYTPTPVTGITPNSTQTGYSQDAPLSTDTTTAWRILSIDDETGEVLITTQGSVNKVTLKGVAGYLYGPNELHRLCGNLYSNAEKGLTARSMTIEDLNKACNYTPSENNSRCVWYLTETTDMQPVIAGGKTYRPRKYIGEIAKLKFYTWDDENGVTHTAKDENSYSNISATNQVLVSRTYYGYNPGVNNPIINEILGETNGWLASSCVDLYSNGRECTVFDMRNTYSGNVRADIMCFYDGGVGLRSLGIRPVILLDITQLNVSDTTKDGSSLLPYDIK